VIKEIKLGYVIEKNKDEIISECCSTLIINIIRVRSMYIYKKKPMVYGWCVIHFYAREDGEVPYLVLILRDAQQRQQVLAKKFQRYSI